MKSAEVIEKLENNLVVTERDPPKLPKSDVFRDGGTRSVVSEWCFSTASAELIPAIQAARLSR
jgi:hypothetical protein